MHHLRCLSIMAQMTLFHSCTYWNLTLKGEWKVSMTIHGYCPIVTPLAQSAPLVLN